MKPQSSNIQRESGSVLMTSILTIAVMSLVVALTLSIASSKYATTFQASSWQESLQGAEAGVDIAMAALNSNTWTGWSTQSGAPPRGAPSGGSTATDKPDSTHYNYIYPPSLTHVGEGNNSVGICVTVDTAGLGVVNGSHWYRIRSVGTADVAGPARVSSEKLDNRLRKVSLVNDRVTGAAVPGGKPQVSRYIEVVAQEITPSLWARALTLRKTITMSGGAYIDSFDSSDFTKSTNGLYDPTKRQMHGDTGSLNSSGSDLKGMFLYGNLTYSGLPVKNTNNVQGTISTPFSVPVNPVPAPVWNAGSIQATPTVINGSTTLTTGTKANPKYLKLSALTVSGGNVLTINAANNTPGDNYIYIWVTGDFTTSGSGYIVQDPNVTAIYYLEGKMTVSGSSFNNQSGRAANLQVYGVTPSDGSTRQWTVSGSGNFIGAVNAPNADVTISGGASYSGSLIGNTIDISGSGGFHYDQALGNLGGGAGNSSYAFASWFEDVR